MRTRTAVITLLALFAVVHACLAMEVSTENGRDRVAFSDWGVSVEIPKPHEKSTVLRDNNTLDCQLYVSGDYVYVFKVTKLPPNTLASTFIEQLIQADVKSSPDGTTKRWELDNRQKELFKGLTRPLKPEMVEVAAVAKVLRGEAGVQSIAMAPVRDETSPVLSVGVIARENLRQEAELRAEVMAGFLEFDRSAPQPRVVPTVPAAPVPPKPTVTAPSPVPSRPAARPAPVYTLKKGDIELIGEVKSVAADGKSLEMLVDTVRMPGTAPTKLNPPRDKKVTLVSAPEGVRAGARITVAGKNDGVGKPIKADYLAVSQR